MTSNFMYANAEEALRRGILDWTRHDIRVGIISADHKPSRFYTSMDDLPAPIMELPVTGRRVTEESDNIGARLLWADDVTFAMSAGIPINSFLIYAVHDGGWPIIHIYDAPVSVGGHLPFLSGHEVTLYWHKSPCARLWLDEQEVADSR